MEALERHACSAFVQHIRHNPSLLINDAGIPNTSHFHNITSVKDALALWDRIKTQKVPHLP